MQPPDLRTAVNRHSWAWLLDLPHRLDLVLEIVDERGVPLLPPSDHRALEVRGRLRDADPALRAAIAAATERRGPQAVAEGGYLFVCFALAPAGVLILAREQAGEDAGADRCRADLEGIGSWLGGAIEANLAGAPSDAAAEQHRIASLRRLLHEGAAGGSLRDVVGAFAEAVSVWHDIEVRGYVAGPQGNFIQEVTLVDADAAATPDELERDAVPGEGSMVRLTPADVERLRFVSVASDVLLLRVTGKKDAVWLLIFAGSVDRVAEASLLLAADLLRESLDGLTAAATVRAVSAIAAHLLRHDDPLELVAQFALGEVLAALHVVRGALEVTALGGGQVLAAGHAELLVESDPRSSFDRLVVSRLNDETGYRLTIVAARDRHRLTAHDLNLLETAADLVWAWVLGTVLPVVRDVRPARLPVAEQIERLAAATIQAGGLASVIVISAPAVAIRPGLLHVWVAKIRNQLRPWDFAGAVTGREIAVLLRDTPAEQAACVSARLRRVCESDQSAPAMGKLSIGLASSSADAPVSGSLVHAARAELAENA
jgi:hypothetical protein